MTNNVEQMLALEADGGCRRRGQLERIGGNRPADEREDVRVTEPEWSPALCRPSLPSAAGSGA